jgi:hypothetical protein
MASTTRRSPDIAGIYAQYEHTSSQNYLTFQLYRTQQLICLVAKKAPSSLSDLTANPLILLKWYYFLEAKLLSLFKGLKIFDDAKSDRLTPHRRAHLWRRLGCRAGFGLAGAVAFFFAALRASMRADNFDCVWNRTMRSLSYAPPLG